MRIERVVSDAEAEAMVAFFERARPEDALGWVPAPAARMEADPSLTWAEAVLLTRADVRRLREAPALSTA